MKRTSFNLAAAFAAFSVLAAPAVAHGWGKGRTGDRDGTSIRMFQFFDANGDEAITMDEVRASFTARFNAADADGDGLLSDEEVTAAVEAWHDEHRARHTTMRIERFDANGDGLLSLEEANSAIEPDRLERIFEHLDADGDGEITKAEMDDSHGGRRSWFRRGHRSH